MTARTTKAATYLMGGSEAETRRLMSQSGMLDPFTRRMFLEAGLQEGMRVLDVGSGAGDVSLLAAALVGPRGAVVGVDRNPAVLATARARAADAGLGNVTFLEGDAGALDLDDDFDAVVGRLVLMYQADPAETLRSLTGHLRPSGIVAFQDYNLTPESIRQCPPTPLWQGCWGWFVAVARRAGIQTEMGYKLHGAYLDAGLPAPKMELNSPVGGGPGWDGYEGAAEAIRSVLPLISKFGIASEEEVGIDSLAGRLRAETVASGGVVKWVDLVSAWSHKP